MAYGICHPMSCLHVLGAAEMIHVKVNGSFAPLKKDGATDKTKKSFNAKDPIQLLRKALANKLRSKHWRIAHAAKSKWMEAAKENAEVWGNAVQGPAIVVVIHCIPGRCDIDAPIKVLLDAFQDILFEDGDDKSIESLVIRKVEPRRDKLEPQVHIYAYSKETEFSEASRASLCAFSASTNTIAYGMVDKVLRGAFEGLREASGQTANSASEEGEQIQEGQ